MPNPQVTDRIKDAPAVVLRAIFAGVGQLLMAADKIWAQVQEQLGSQPPKPAGTQAPKPPQAPTPPQQPLGETGNVTLLRPQPTPTEQEEQPPAAPASPAVTRPAAAPKPAAAAPKPAAAAPKPAPTPKPAAAAPKPAPAAGPAAGPAAVTPPIPGYDDLSIASLRARLRVLDADAVHGLLEYEKAHEHRDDVITMFERRLAKIEEKAG